jgi:hypothetical protein
MRVIQTQSRKISNRAYRTTEKEMYEKACSKIVYGGYNHEQLEKKHKKYLEQLRKENEEWKQKFLK